MTNAMGMFAYAYAPPMSMHGKLNETNHQGCHTNTRTHASHHVQPESLTHHWQTQIVQTLVEASVPNVSCCKRSANSHCPDFGRKNPSKRELLQTLGGVTLSRLRWKLLSKRELLQTTRQGSHCIDFQDFMGVSCCDLLGRFVIGDQIQGLICECEFLSSCWLVASHVVQCFKTDLIMMKFEMLGHATGMLQNATTPATTTGSIDTTQCV